VGCGVPRAASILVGMSKSRQIIAAAGAIASLAGGGAAALAADGDTTVTVSPPTQLVAGQKAPFDAPGVKAIRHGKAIPKGYVLVGQKVQYNIGAKTAGAALKFTCPDDKVLKTFGVTGKAGFLALRDYPDHHTTDIISYPPPKTEQASGTVYAVCR
jgi:hypothetical protein